MSYLMKVTTVEIARKCMDCESIGKLLHNIQIAAKYSAVFYHDKPCGHKCHMNALRSSLKAVRVNLDFLQMVRKLELKSFEAFLFQLRRLSTVVERLVKAAIQRKNSSLVDSLKFRLAFGLRKPLRPWEEMELRKEFGNIEFIFKTWNDIQIELSEKFHSQEVLSNKIIADMCKSDAIPVSTSSQEERKDSDVLPEGQKNQCKPYRGTFQSVKIAHKHDERQQCIQNGQNTSVNKNKVVNLTEYFEQKIQAKLLEPACSSSSTGLDCVPDVSHAERKARYIAHVQGASKDD